MHNLNYPEIPNSWNNKEKTKMANFNEKVKRGIGYIMNSQEFFIYKAGTIKEFARMIHDELYLLTNTYRLFIQYKTTHRAKKMAGHCFLWDNSHGDHMADPGNGIELRSLNDASQDDCEGFGNPRFDGVSAAILIADSHVFVYGDVQIEADSIRKDKKHVICIVSLCGSLVSYFRIPAEVFDRLFGLKENFPEQYEKVFGKTEDAKPVQEENDLIEEAKRSVELCKNLLYSTKQVIDRSVDLIQGAIIEIEDRSDQAVELIQGALIDIEDRKRELDNFDDILSSLDDALYKSTQKEERREEK